MRSRICAFPCGGCHNEGRMEGPRPSRRPRCRRRAAAERAARGAELRASGLHLVCRRGHALFYFDAGQRDGGGHSRLRGRAQNLFLHAPGLEHRHHHGRLSDRFPPPYPGGGFRGGQPAGIRRFGARRPPHRPDAGQLLAAHPGAPGLRRENGAPHADPGL